MGLRQFARERKRRSELFSEVVCACKKLLNDSENASKSREYISGRLSRHSIDKFDIGYFPDNNNLDELSHIVGKDVLEELQLAFTIDIPYRGHIAPVMVGLLSMHNVIFPFYDEYSNIIALAGRSLLSEKELERRKISKYKNSFFHKSLHLFGLNNAKESILKKDKAIIVEGQIDCIKCHEAGIYNVVALTGSKLSRYQLYLLKKLTNNIYLLMDNDDPGQESVEKTIRKFSKWANFRKLSLPEQFKDVYDYIKKSHDTLIFNGI